MEIYMTYTVGHDDVVALLLQVAGWQRTFLSVQAFGVTEVEEGRRARQR